MDDINYKSYWRVITESTGYDFSGFAIDSLTSRLDSFISNERIASADELREKFFRKRVLRGGGGEKGTNPFGLKWRSRRLATPCSAFRSRRHDRHIENESYFHGLFHLSFHIAKKGLQRWQRNKRLRWRLTWSHSQ